MIDSCDAALHDVSVVPSAQPSASNQSQLHSLEGFVNPTVSVGLSPAGAAGAPTAGGLVSSGRFGADAVVASLSASCIPVGDSIHSIHASHDNYFKSKVKHKRRLPHTFARARSQSLGRRRQSRRLMLS